MAASQGGAARVHSLADYEKRLRAAMRFVPGKTRDAVAREVTGGISARMAQEGGDFARLAPALDDPAWVGRQMLKVYGVSAGAVVVFALLGALLAAASAPGLLVRPADSAAAIAGGVVGFAALLVLLFFLLLRTTAFTALATAVSACAARIIALLVPVDGASLLDLASGGEVVLYLLASFLLIVVAGVPAAAMRVRAERE